MKKESGRNVSGSVKIENHLEAEQVAGFLRALADELEGKKAGVLQQYGIDLRDFNRLKLGLRRGETGELFLKIKVKDSGVRQQYAAPGKTKRGGEEDPVRSEYKILKKRLKTSFAALGRAIAGNEQLDRYTVQSFLRDSKKMTDWPGYGDPFYEEYNRLCLAFEDADKAKDPARLAECHRNLTDCMKRCHARYKR